MSLTTLELLVVLILALLALGSFIELCIIAGYVQLVDQKMADLVSLESEMSQNIVQLVDLIENQDRC